MKFLGLVFLVGAFLSSALFAAPYNVTHSTIKWQGGKKIVLTDIHYGKINLKSGSLEVDNNSLKSGKFVIDMKTITCDDIKNPKKAAELVGHLSSDDFFSVGKHPVSTFEFNKVVKSKDAGTVTLKGNLTLKGEKKPLDIPATISWKDGKVTAKAKFKIDRTKWNVRYGSDSFFKGLGDKVILNDISFDIALMASAPKAKVPTVNAIKKVTPKKK